MKEQLRSVHLAGHDHNATFALWEYLVKNFPNNPPFTVVTGDLTSYGDLQSMEQIYKFLFGSRDEYDADTGFEGLALDPNRTFVVPGNHDMKFMRQVRRRFYVGSTDEERLENYFAVFGSASFPRLLDLTTLSKQFVFRNSPVFLACLDSTVSDLGHFADGKIGSEAINTLRKDLLRIPEDSLLIVAFHHNLLSIPGKDVNWQTILHDMSTFSAFLCQRHRAIVLNGHEHNFCIGRVSFPHLSDKEITVVVADSVTIDTNGERNGFNLIHFHDNQIHLERIAYQRASTTFKPTEEYRLL